jgi:deazaflavin-dependent oxidoreductase (nitroreductase family)
MVEQVREVQPPGGLMRIFLRFPILLYRAGLGWLLGERALMMTHTGRISGLARRVVLEVMRHDEAADAYIVASGWGEKSDWFQNISKTPQVEINVGRRHFRALAQRLPLDEAVDEVLDYARRHPTAIRQLGRMIGYQVEHTPEGYRALVAVMPIVAIRLVREENKQV